MMWCRLGCVSGILRSLSLSGSDTGLLVSLRFQQCSTDLMDGVAKPKTDMQRSLAVARSCCRCQQHVATDVEQLARIAIFL